MSPSLTFIMPTKRFSGRELRWLGGREHDRLTRLIVILVFALLAFGNVHGAIQIAFNASYHTIEYTVLHIAERISNGLFLALVVVITVTRLRPIRKASGIEPRVSALLGTFMLAGLAVLPRAELPPIALGISCALVITGLWTAVAVLRCLGKSFSIMPEARRLITHGPYAVVRHPLYICEEIAVLGVFIQVLSPMACVIVMTHALVQFRRMLNEERILRSTFAEYASYAERTPRLVPCSRKSLKMALATLMSFGSTGRPQAVKATERPAKA
jgi:protein-S-isoprenylcysteine O-methyltransferase Ste14